MRRAAILAASLLAAGLAAVPSAASARTPARPIAHTHRSPAAFTRAAHRTPAIHRAASRPVTTIAPGASGLDPHTSRLQPSRNGTVKVTVTGAEATVAQQAHRLGGRVLSSADGANSVLIAKTKLARLASAPGVGAVRAPIKAYAEDTAPDASSEGVGASGADAWQAASDGGSGVTVAIVDIGFTGLAAEEANGVDHLPADTEVVNDGCTVDGQSSVDTDEHGTAVAEIVHQMAPAAHLVLYCIDTSVDFAAAAADIVNRHIKIASSSLGFAGESRGDGTGAQGGDGVTTSGAVELARKAGVLWIQSAGNEAENHWSGTLTDADKDHDVDLDGVYNESKDQYENDAVFVAPGSDAAPAYAEIDLKWDQWPTTNSAVTLEAYGFQCTTDFTSTGCNDVPINPDGDGNAIPVDVAHVAGTAPFASLPITNTQGFDQIWYVYIEVGNTAYPTTRYDLTYQGDVDGPSLLACASADANNNCVISPRSYQGSLAEPASSPYAVAVGAASAGADPKPGAPARGALEPFSSQGPTIDGRTKPEIAGWDGTSSYVYGPECNGTDPSDPQAPDCFFYGTSAAAPHVAGAAALVAAANADLDAAQLQNFLEQRAGSGSPLNPPTNSLGHGLLTLGAAPSGTAPIAPPAGAVYAPLSHPVRILDTRTSYLPTGNKGALTAGKARTIVVPGLPADATAVAINLTGVGATGGTFLSAYPGGTAWPGTSNLNLSATDATAAGFAVVPVHNAAITVRNATAAVNVVVDELGYFGTGAETGRYTALSSPKRVLNTRTTVGGHHGKLAPGRSVSVNPALPVGATAAIVNVTTADSTAGGYVSASPNCSLSTSTLNFTRLPRANLAVVTLDSHGHFCVADGSSAADVFVDVVGFMGATGARYVALPSAYRIVDTRSGNGGTAGGHASQPVAADRLATFYGANVGDVPMSATGLLTGLVEASTTAPGFLTMFGGTTLPSSATSSLNFSAGRVVSNAAIVGVPATGASAAHEYSVYNSAGNTHVVVDLFGYFI